MKLQTIFASILLASATPLFASGSHEDSHDDKKKTHGHTSEQDVSHQAAEKKAHGHDDGHSDDHGGAHASSIGIPAEYAPDNRQVEVILDDSMRFTFTPSLNSLKEGEAVTFIVRNDGKLNHEFSIGSAEEQQAHLAMMKQMPDMKHNDPNTVSLSPGAEDELNWRFSGSEEVVFSCNIPGHYEAGMHHEAKIVSK